MIAEIWGEVVGEMESYKCLPPPLEPLDQVVKGIECGAKKEASLLFGFTIQQNALKSNLFQSLIADRKFIHYHTTWIELNTCHNQVDGQALYFVWNSSPKKYITHCVLSLTIVTIRLTGTPSAPSPSPALAALTRPCYQTYSRSDLVLWKRVPSMNIFFRKLPAIPHQTPC